MVTVPACRSPEVPEGKVAKNRVHLDVRADNDPIGLVRGGGARWTVMQDPEGNEFCVV